MKTRTGYLIKRGKTFYAVWEIAGRKHVKTTKKTVEKEARKELARIMEPFLVEDEVRTLESVKSRIEGAKGELAQFEDERNPPLTLDHAWGAFERSTARPDSGERTLSQYAAELERFKKWMAIQHPGPDKENPTAVPLRSVTPEIAEAYAQDLTAAKLSASTYNQHRNFLTMLWRVLAKQIRGNGNPWEGITRRRLNPLATRKQALTPGQFEALLAAAESDPEARDLFIVLAWTGLRLVDGVKLTWGAVDFPRRVITLAPQKTARRTGKSVSIPMFPAVLEVLNRRQDGKVVNPVRLVFKEIAEEYDRDSGSTLSKRLHAHFEKAGMVTAENRAGQARAVVCFGAHSLRHHFVSAATMAGLPAPMIKSITGHTTDTMLEHYQHIGQDVAAEFGRRLGDGKAALPAGKMIDAMKVRTLADGMTPKTWRQVKADLIALAEA